METIQPNDDISPKKADPTGRPTGRIVLGVLFLLPSLFCCIFQLLVPTIKTLSMSFQKVSPLLSEKSVYVGLGNYAHVLGDAMSRRAIGFTLTTILVRVFVIALVPLFLAWAVGQFGRSLRLGLRIFLTLPIVFFAPVAIAVTWSLSLNPTTGLFPFEGSWLGSPESARNTLLFIDALYFFGLASGLGLMIYLPLWRRSADTPQPTFREVWKPMLATWAPGILGIIAATLSTFAPNFVMTQGGPAGSTMTLGILLYKFAFVNFNMGPAAAIASLILLVSLVLGILSGLLVILTRLRLNIVDTRSTPEKANRVLPGIVLALLALLTIGICLLGALPFGWLIPQAGNGLAHLLEEVPIGQVLVNTYVPALVTATLQVLIAYLAALSIGALRPFGKYSEWLLLLFSPWLFITVLPLSLTSFMTAQKAGLLNTLQGALSPILFSIPALFILTIFFAGRASKLPRETTEGEAQDVSNFFRHFLLPSLPLAGLLWLILIFFNGQDVFWSLLVNNSPATYNLNVALFQLVGMFSLDKGVLAAAITFLVLPVCVFFFICLVPFQVFYLDRLSLYTETSVTGEAVPKPEQK